MSASEGDPQLRSQQARQPPVLPLQAAQVLLGMACERTGAAAAALFALRGARLEAWCEQAAAPLEGLLLPWLESVLAASPGAEAPDEPVRMFEAPADSGVEGCLARCLFMEGRCVGAVVLVRPLGGPRAVGQALSDWVPLAEACMGQHLARWALQEQTERLMDLARASGDWMWETDALGRYRWISGDFERMTGLQAERCVGNLVPDEPGVDGLGQPLHPPVWLRDKLLRPEPFARFASCLTTPAGPRYVSRSGQPVFDALGTFSGFRGTARDVTARKLSLQSQRERALLERQVADAERSSREKSEFMSRISHELRTPLNAIVGFGQLMAMDKVEPLGPAQRARLEDMQQSGRALLRLIDALLEVAGVNDGPQGAPAPDEDPPAAACGSGSAAEPSRQVLYVEDEPLNVVLMQEIFRGQPAWTLHVARDGTEGVEMAREVRPDLALIDMNLPDFNGIEVLRRLRADPALKGLRCIALSADAMADQISAAREAGFDDYWTKPIDLTRLLAAIGEALKAANLARR